MDYLLPPLIALAIWWVGTGVVLLLDGMPRTSFRWSLGVSSALALGALVCIADSADDPSVAGAYAGFTCAVLVWGWHELTFLTGWLTGPRKQACSAPSHGPTRFRQAVGAIAWHELALVGAGVTIAALTWQGPNQVAGGTFALLWVMRLSAKFNLFLGVRNRGEAFLPPHLTYLASYFRHRRWNWLLPLSLAFSVLVAGALIAAAVQSDSAGSRTALLLIGTMGVLALVEHLLMVTPLPPTALWRWAMRPPEAAR